MKNKHQSTFLSVGLILISFGLLINVVTNMFEPSFNAIFGPGEKVIVPSSNSDEWDTNYYSLEAKNEEDIRERNNKLVKEVASEGIILLKNDGVLPLAKQITVAPFGYGYKNPTYVGLGSGTTKFKNPFTPKNALEKHFLINEEIEEITLNNNNVTELKEAFGTTNNSAYGITNRIKEIKSSAYKEANKEKLKNSHGLVFITRSSAENMDLKADRYVDGTPHQLALTRNELETIRFSNVNCASTTVILNVPSHFEIEPIMDNITYEVDAILHVAYPGSIGFEALSEILVGNINPSGRTVDTFTTNLLSSPAMQNFGANYYKNYTDIPYVEYEEGIYVGYKYFETLYSDSLVDHTINFNYDEIVQIPFGFGLSYTFFQQKITNFEIKNDILFIEVEVENIGSYAGKDAILIFYGAPYTKFDKTNKIEKSSKNLIEFSKTDLIKPGEKYTESFEISLDKFASYYSNYSIDGEKVGSYFLEEGEYNIYLSYDSHNYYEKRTFNIDENVFYNDALSPDEALKDTIVSNKFDILSEYMLQEDVTNLSRTNFINTYPEKVKNKSKNLDEKYVDISNQLLDFDYESHPTLGNGKNSEVYNSTEPLFEPNELNLSSLRGADYDDPLWNELLKNINFNDKSSYDELRDLFIFAGFSTSQLTSINKPTTNDFDGPSGFNDAYNVFKESFYCYPSETLIAATFNEQLITKLGEYIGEEGLLNNISGWYAPGLNIHRTPFGGRNFEYYSEDPILSGFIAKATVEGVSKKGIYPYLKHFILNEQEAARSRIRVWVGEQALREIYLKPFEIVIKESRTEIKYTTNDSGIISVKNIPTPMAIMSSFNFVGPYPSSCCKPLLTDLLRKEWGFAGFVISDYEVDGSHDARIRAGNDLYLWSSNRIEVKEDLNHYIKDISSTTSRNALLKSIKNVAFTVVNSNAFNNVAPGFVSYYKTPIWKIVLNYTFEYSFYVIGSLLISVFIFLLSINHINSHKKEKSIHD